MPVLQTNPSLLGTVIEIEGAARDVVRLQLEFGELTVRNFFATEQSEPCPTCGNCSRTELPPAERERRGREQHVLHVRLNAAYERLNALLLT